MSLHRRASVFETAHGHVRRCPCCSWLEVRFGNALLALDADDLPAVLDQLGVAEAQAGERAGVPTTAAPADEVTLLLGDTGSGWVFSRTEAAELHRLVAGAQLLLDLAA
jgi:hypothetical protein